MKHFRIKALSCVLLVAAGLALAGCYGTFEGFTLTADDPPVSELKQMKAECDAQGGYLQRIGMLAEIACVTPLKDGGKACQTSADCEGACMVEEGGRFCQKSAPLLGCYSYVEDDGRVQEICVD